MFLSVVLWAVGQTPADTLRLSEVEVGADRRHQAPVATDGSILLDAAALSAAPGFFGENDLVRRLMAGAGVNTLSDYSSGMSVDGMDYSQNLYRLNGVAVQFPYHFGGIFSTFNSAHYCYLRLQKSIHRQGDPDCLGGIVSASGDRDVPARLGGNVNVGMLASSLTLRQPVGNRVAVILSGRASYIDALYHKLLATDDTDVRYNLYDFDAQIMYKFDRDNSLDVFAHTNSDRLKYLDSNYSMATSMRWTNTVAGARWQGPGAGATVGYSGMENRLGLEMPRIVIAMPTSVRQYSADGFFDFTVRNVALKTGAAVSHWVTRPQSVSVVGFGDGDIYASRDEIGSSLTKIWASATVALSRGWRVTAGIDANAYFGPDRFNRIDIDPRVTLGWYGENGSLNLHLGRYHQYIHQVGFSEIGMASNFKVAPTREIPPQQSLNFVAGGGYAFPAIGLKANLDIYWKRIFNQPEYSGGVLDLLDNDYTPWRYIRSCNGYNTGIGMTLSHEYDGFTASLSYGFGIARRRIHGSQEYFTASSEVRNSMNVAAGYNFPGGKWSVNASFVYASGRPVTPVTAVYFIGERIMVEYGKSNSANLPSYQRLDLGASYRFTVGRFINTVALSVINVYGHRNVEISTYAFNINSGTIRQRQVSSLYRFLPSLSYTIDF